jgi:subtilisin family serine protease
MVQCGSLRGTVQGIVEGAKWVVEDRRRRPGPAVANWSFIADTAARIPELDAAIEMLRAAGVPVIVSAGNVDVNACRISPGNAPGSFVVGASTVRSAMASDGQVHQVDIRVPGTAWGPCVDLYAPGDSVMLPSVDRELKPMYQLWNGTSMATGYVSGAAALFLEAFPQATPDDVAEYLKETATTNVMRGAFAPIKRLLYVGAPRTRDRDREPLRSVAEVRDEMERRR